MILATYNLHLVQDFEQIIKNIKKMADHESVDVFCLQEVVRAPYKEFIISSLLKELGNDWSAVCYVGQEKSWLSLGNGVVWNKKKLHLKNSENILLPSNQRLTLNESVFSYLIAGDSFSFERRSIVATFQYGRHTVQIANVHLDNVGGPSRRQKQLEYILQKLNKNIAFTVVCGDFNTFDLKQTGEEACSLQSILGVEYTDAAYDCGWTADINRVNLTRANPIFAFIIKYLHIHIRRKLDYIWVKGAKRVSLKKLNLPGSDHLPLIVTLDAE